MAQKPKKAAVGKSWKRQRREAYFSFGDDRFREAVYDLAKAVEAGGLTLPPSVADYVGHVEGVRTNILKPGGGNA